MVYYSKQADSDLDEILKGLLTWHKHTLTREYCLSYISDILNICDNLATQTFHLDTQYEIHKRYGKKVYKYSRNKNTIWYIIYNTDTNNNIFINKIINNYLTIS
jgi:hypothetical protein